MFPESGVSFRGGLVPLLAAFMVTLVPFYHGAERHLEETYVENPENAHGGLLLVDFAYLFVEACVLVSAAALVAYVKALIVTLLCLWMLDVAWWITQRIVTRRGGPIAKWAIINSAASVSFGLLLIGLHANWVSPTAASWILLALAIGRTVADYSTSWNFYFPDA